MKTTTYTDHPIGLPNVWTNRLYNPHTHFVRSLYYVDEELKRAVEMAIRLNRPLLLTGEPGTGKTLLANAIAYDLHKLNSDFLEHPLIFTCQTSSVAKDLFYTYDALAHFYDANHSGQAERPNPMGYIYPSALGQAIALTNPKEVGEPQFLSRSRNHEGEPYSQCHHSVVLIDEIDKAPRDFPNDLLYSIEKQWFEVKETRHIVHRPQGTDYRIVVVITSNTEKMLPKPFLRRCVFYHIDFPSRDKLLHIIRRQLRLDSDQHNRLTLTYEELVDHFEYIRTLALKKQPGPAELIDWLRILELDGLIREGGFKAPSLTETDKQTLLLSYSTLAKTKEDLRILKKHIDNLIKA